MENVISEEGSQEALIVVCAANMTGSDQCPHDCRKCFLGGDRAIEWSFDGHDYIKYYPNRETIQQEVKEILKKIVEGATFSEGEKPFFNALVKYLCRTAGAELE